MADRVAVEAGASSRERLYRGLELVVLFGLAPAVFVWLRTTSIEPPIIPSILLFMLLCAAILMGDAGFRFHASWRKCISPSELRRVLGYFAAGAVALGLATANAAPGDFFRFPIETPGSWLLVMCVYPLLSVLPQEFVYRVFFFHRYRGLLTNPAARIMVSAVAFGWVHVAFGSWISVVLSGIGGVLFAWSYERTRSLRLVWLEHALYGCCVFTVGLGQYFYAK